MPRGFSTQTQHTATLDMFSEEHPTYLQGFLVTHDKASGLLFTAFARTESERTAAKNYLLSTSD